MVEGPKEMDFDYPTPFCFSFQVTNKPSNKQRNKSTNWKFEVQHAKNNRLQVVDGSEWIKRKRKRERERDHQYIQKEGIVRGGGGCSRSTGA